jgi:hypothetical protein
MRRYAVLRRFSSPISGCKLETRAAMSVRPFPFPERLQSHSSLAPPRPDRRRQKATFPDRRRQILRLRRLVSSAVIRNMHHLSAIALATADATTLNCQRAIRTLGPFQEKTLARPENTSQPLTADFSSTINAPYIVQPTFLVKQKLRNILHFSVDCWALGIGHLCVPLASVLLRAICNAERLRPGCPSRLFPPHPSIENPSRYTCKSVSRG